MWSARQAADGALLFARRGAVEAASATVEPILGGAAPVCGCEPGTWGPAQEDQPAADLGGWHDPQEGP